MQVFSHLLRREPLEGMIEEARRLPASAYLGRVTPSRFVHIGQSPAGARDVLSDNPGPEAASALQNSRWSIANVWRSIKPIAKNPLTVCDARSVPDEDLIPNITIIPPKGSRSYDNVSAGKGFESYMVKANPDHRWYFASAMTPEEVLRMESIDSKTDGSGARAGAALCLRGSPDQTCHDPGKYRDRVLGVP